MRFTLSDEQSALAAAAASLFEEAAATSRAAALDGKPGFQPAAWRVAAQEFGLTGIGISVSRGGAGGALVDLAVVAEECGRALSSLPVWTAAVAARCLQLLGDSEKASAALAGVVAGERLPAVVGLRAQDSLEIADDGVRCLVSGSAAHVGSGAWLTGFLVVAADRGQPRLLLVDGVDERVRVEPERALDPTRELAKVTFYATPAVDVSTAGLSTVSCERVAAEAGVLLAAEQVGAGQGALDMAVEYANSRRQFGRPIGSFQALKHLLADLYVDLQTARDVTRYAAWALSTEIADAEAIQLAHLTRAIVTPRTVRVAAGNLQVLGGIGYTWEHSAHLYYKRSLTSAHLVSEVDADLDTIADAVGLGD